MKLFEFLDKLDEAPKKFPEGHYTHTPGTLEVMPTQDKTMWADAGELPKKFNVTKMKIAIYDEQDDEDPYSYGNGGLLVYHNAGTWKMYTDDVTRVQIADYLGIANKDIDFSEQGMQSEEYMHFDIEDDAVAQLIEKGAFKLEETATEDDMSTGTVPVGKKGKTRRATGINDNPYDHNEGEDHPALVNAALWNMKDIYQQIMAGEEIEEDDMFSYGDLIQYLDMSGIPGDNFYEDFIDTVSTAVSQAQPGGFAGQGDAVLVDKKFAPQIKTLYQQFKAATAKIKGIKEKARELPSPTYKIPASQSIPMALYHLDQMEVTKQLRQAAGFPESAYVYFDDADLVYGSKTVWPQCGVDRKCKFGDAVEALKKFAKANPYQAEDNVDDVYPGTGDIYGYTWNCKKCGTENEFSMSRQDAQEYIDEWESDNEDLVADGETGSAALIDSLAQGEDSGFHYGSKCKKCGTEAKDPYSESINDILRLSGLK